MAFDCSNNQRKPLLFVDLFKSSPRSAAPEGASSCSSSSAQFLSSCDSSSSGFSTPLYSDLGSSESEDGDFIAELTRQMAECMLQEGDDCNVVADNCSEASCLEKSAADEIYAHSGDNKRFHASTDGSDDQIQRKFEIYQVKNQPPPVAKEKRLSRGKRVKKIESAQQKKAQKTEQQYMQYRGRMMPGYSGSGMQAVFLGGSGIGPPGTGVFLPRDPAELKSKSGCTVLIPTRVLQVLEHHLNRFQQDSSAPPLSGGSPKEERTLSSGWDGHQEQEDQPQDSDEMQLPQEWTY